ncbi:MAG: hypothetical protein RIR37_1173, partial [Verrucomicrobiota bacterium]
SAQQVPQHGFRLIIRVMCQQYFAATMLRSAVGKELMSRMTRGSLQRLTRLLHPLANVAAADLAGQIERLGKFFDESGIGIRSLAAQEVIEVANDEIFESRLEEDVEQCHRVRSARDTDQVTRAPRCVTKPGNPW